jgi:Skp family chaperone for outer membrane proteins
MQSGLVMDNRTQKEKAERFQSLQEQVASIDKDATTQLSKFRDKMTKEVYAEMEEIITDWSKSNNIDLVMGKIESVYVKEEFEITDSIVEVFKSKGLYVELIEEQLLEENEKES